MIEYKVGGMVYITTNHYNGNLREGAEITCVGKLYAEAVAEDGTRVKLNMAKNRVCDRQRVNNSVGDVYANKEKYDEKCAIEKYAQKIKSTVNNLGYSGFRECSMEDLRKIAAILKINLDE